MRATNRAENESEKQSESDEYNKSMYSLISEWWHKEAEHKIHFKTEWGVKMRARNRAEKKSEKQYESDEQIRARTHWFRNGDTKKLNIRFTLRQNEAEDESESDE